MANARFYKSRAMLVVAALSIEALMAGAFQNCGSSEGTVIQPAEFQAGGTASTQKWETLMSKEPLRRSSQRNKNKLESGAAPAACDGVTDDTNDLQALFDEAVAVRIPENSRCKATGPIYIRHPIDVSAEANVEFHFAAGAGFVIQASNVTFASFRILSEEGGLGCQFEIDETGAEGGGRHRNVLIADISSQGASCFIKDAVGYVASDGQLYKNINAGVRDQVGNGPLLAGALSDRQ